MEKSESIKNIAMALVKFQSLVGKIKKDSNNPFFKSKYAALPDILDSIQQPLIESGLTVNQFPTGQHGLTTILLHESGEYMLDTYEMSPTKNDPQGIGSCITYQRRYALGAILSLNIDEDDDGNAASTPNNFQNKNNGQPDNNQQEDNKPWLTDKQFKLAMERITNGENGVVEKLTKAFKMKKEYKAQLQEAEKGVPA